jgi:hypothetical protein
MSVGVALAGMQSHRLRHIKLSYLGLSGCTILYTLSHKLLDFRERWNWTWNVYVQILSETFLILRRIKRDIIINVLTSPCKCPLSNFMQIVRWEPSCSLRGDGQTYDEANSRISQCCDREMSRRFMWRSENQTSPSTSKSKKSLLLKEPSN